jgi:hypothetical protein
MLTKHKISVKEATFYFSDFTPAARLMDNIRTFIYNIKAWMKPLYIT